MSGNIPVTTTIFESGLQAKINLVDSSTPIEDIIALVRAGELIDTIDNSAIATELQLRLDSVDGSTTPEQYIELAAAYGKVTNEIKDIVSSGGGGGNTFKASELGTSKSYSLSAATSPLILTPPTGKVIRLDTLMLNDSGILSDTSVYVGSDLIINGDLRFTGAINNTFIIGNSSYANSSSGFSSSAAWKESITANEPNQTITIETTDTTQEVVYFSVTYGDLV